MTDASSDIRAVSRRTLLTGGLASGFAARLPSAAARASNEPVQPPDVTDGQVRAQRLHPHRRDRQDDAGHAAGRDGAGRLHRDRDDPGRGARCRLVAGHARARAAERQALRQSRCSASRSPAIPIRSARSGRRCARPAPARARMLVQAAAQQWKVDPASCTTSKSAGDARRRADASSPMARSPPRPATRRRRRTCR